MYKFIIAEGFDNSGKTTLLNRLSQEFNIPVTHSPGHKVDMRDSLLQILFESKRQDTLRDRICLISEEVYGKILRGKSEFDSDSKVWWKLLIDCKPVIIFCRPHNDNIFNTLDVREQMDGVMKHRTDLLRRYDEVMEYIKNEYGQDLQILDYDYVKDPEATQIINMIRRIYS